MLFKIINSRTTRNMNLMKYVYIYLNFYSILMYMLYNYVLQYTIEDNNANAAVCPVFMFSNVCICFEQSLCVLYWEGELCSLAVCGVCVCTDTYIAVSAYMKCIGLDTSVTNPSCISVSQASDLKGPYSWCLFPVSVAQADENNVPPGQDAG